MAAARARSWNHLRPSRRLQRWLNPRKIGIEPQQLRASSESALGMRVILPPSSEPAILAAEQTAEPKRPIQPVQEVQARVEQQVEKADPKKAERDLKKERRRYAERRAKRIAAARAHRQLEPREQTVPGIMAFGNYDSRTGFFGN